jgi:hypothetical protein
MSTINSKNVQVGTSGVANQNFTLYQPASPDGTVRLGVGNSGVTTGDVLTVNSSGLTVSGALSATTGTFSGAVQASGVATNLYPLVSGTAVASTSGTSIDFTGIPSWVKRVTVMFNGVSTSGTSDLQIQLGTSGGVEATSYVGCRVAFSAANTLGTSANSTGIAVFGPNASSDAFSGVATICFIGSNTWSANGTTGASAPRGFLFGFSKALSGTLDRVRITTVNGTDTFDAGTINILYE